MTLHRSLGVIVSLGSSLFASAQIQNTIVQWNPPENVPANAYEIDQEFATIRILTPGGYDFRFYAVDGSGNPGTGIINNITVAPGATGDFTLLIDHPTPDPAPPAPPNRGALQWSAGDLRYPGGTCTIVGIDIEQALIPFDPDGQGPLPAVQHIYCENITGPINSFLAISCG